MFPTHLEKAIQYVGSSARVASDCGITRGHLTRLRHGDRALSPELEERIAAALRRRAKEFVDRAQAIAGLLDG